MSFPRCRGVLGPPWVPLPGCPGPPGVALLGLPGPLRCAEAFCQSFLAIPGGFPRASWPLAGAALFAWVSWPGFPCRALPVHPGPVTGASWPPVTLPGCPGFAFLAFPCFCQAAKTWQHDGGHPADKFFMWQQRKRTVFDQILAEAFLPAKTWPHEALLLHASRFFPCRDLRRHTPKRCEGGGVLAKLFMIDVVVGPLETRQPFLYFPPLSSLGGKPPYRPPFWV